ncbi:MAG: hypothetical protein ACRDJE_00330 [Dehalococcoidia bacterium]
MLRTVEGVFRNGRIELRETPGSAADGTPVLVTFLLPGSVDLDEHGIGPDAATELRARLAAFADEWESPEMDIYDDYDAARARLQAR